MRKIRTIKEILGIDIELLYENSVFKTDSIAETNDNKNFLLFNLKSKFLKIFDQFQISIFDGKAEHLELRASNCKPNDLKKVIGLIIDEYGPDENNQNLSDLNTFELMSWWFKNDKHEQTYDEYDNIDELYYGFMIGIEKEIGCLSILSYSNIDLNLNKKNWLQHRV